jgi:D-psicose/D-tagatose/L-ribulose 3-epimerase
MELLKHGRISEEKSASFLGSRERHDSRSGHADRRASGIQNARSRENSRREGDCGDRQTGNDHQHGLIRLSCSNLAWDPGEDAIAYAKLRMLGFTGIEIAPTRVWSNWVNATPKNAASLKQKLADEGFVVPALQAIFFGKSKLKLFDPGSRNEILNHMVSLAEVAQTMESKVLVFGAPKMRDAGQLKHDQAVEVATPLLRQMAGICHDHGTRLCIEPNAREYGCNFIWTTAQAKDLIMHVDHPGFGLHLDAAAMHLEGEVGPEAIRKYFSEIQHFHVSEPGLARLQSSTVDHLANLLTLQSKGYKGWVSLETTDAAGFNASAETLSAWRNLCEVI